MDGPAVKEALIQTERPNRGDALVHNNRTETSRFLLEDPNQNLEDEDEGVKNNTQPKILGGISFSWQLITKGHLLFLSSSERAKPDLNIHKRLVLQASVFECINDTECFF